MSAVAAAPDIKITESERVVLAEVGEETPDSFTVFAIGFSAQNGVSNERIIQLYEDIDALVEKATGVTMHTHGRVACMAYESALTIAVNVERARAAHQAGSS